MHKQSPPLLKPRPNPNPIQQPYWILNWAHHFPAWFPEQVDIRCSNREQSGECRFGRLGRPKQPHSRSTPWPFIVVDIRTPGFTGNPRDSGIMAHIQAIPISSSSKFGWMASSDRSPSRPAGGRSARIIVQGIAPPAPRISGIRFFVATSTPNLSIISIQMVTPMMISKPATRRLDAAFSGFFHQPGDW